MKNLYLEVRNSPEQHQRVLKELLEAFTGFSERLASFLFSFAMAVAFSIVIPEEGEKPN